MESLVKGSSHLQACLLRFESTTRVWKRGGLQVEEWIRSWPCMQAEGATGTMPETTESRSAKRATAASATRSSVSTVPSDVPEQSTQSMRVPSIQLKLNPEGVRLHAGIILSEQHKHMVSAGNEFGFTIHTALTVGSDRLRALIENGKRIQTEHQFYLPLDDGTLDDEHCTIRFCDGRWILHAHDTKNGTKYLCDHTMTKLEANQDLPLKEGATRPLASFSTGNCSWIPLGTNVSRYGFRAW